MMIETTKIVQEIALPRIIFGLDSVNLLGKELASLLPNKREGKVLVITDDGVKRVGIVDRVIRLIHEGNPWMDVEVHIKGEGELSLEQVYEILPTVRNRGYDLFIGVGGGSVLDLTKFAAALATNLGDPRRYVELDIVENPAKPKIAIPTAAGSGSEISYASVVTVEGVKRILHSRYLIPELAIIDPLLTLSTPPFVTAAGGIDALTHAVESYTAATANPFCDMLALKATELIFSSLQNAYAHGEDIQSRYSMSLASLLAEMAAVGGAGVHLVHAIAHGFPAKYKIPHGVLCGLFLPAVMEYIMPARMKRLAELAQFTGIATMEVFKGLSDEARAKKFVETLHEFLRFFGISRYAVKLERHEIDLAVENIFKYFKRQLSRSPREIVEKDLKQILEQYVSYW